MVDSPGLREVFQFYRDVYSNGLGASTLDLFSPKAVGRPVNLLKDHQLAIAIGSNWFADAWTEENRHWGTARQEASAVPFPTSHGQKPGSASTLGGWAVAISRAAKNKDLAWALLKVMQRNANQTYIANHAGFVPPSKVVAKSKGFLNYAPPFNAAFAAALPNARVVPSNEAGYPVWVQGIGQATGQIASNPKTTVADAIKILRDTMVNQLGADKVDEDEVDKATGGRRRLGRRPTSRRRRVGDMAPRLVIDCDVHHARRTDDELLDRLPRAWRSTALGPGPGGIVPLVVADGYPNPHGCQRADECPDEARASRIDLPTMDAPAADAGTDRSSRLPHACATTSMSRAITTRTSQRRSRRRSTGPSKCGSRRTTA